MEFFCGDSSIAKTNQEALRRILIIFAKLNPSIKYVQGMNEVVAPLFYVFRNDPDGTNALNCVDPNLGLKSLLLGIAKPCPTRVSFFPDPLPRLHRRRPSPARFLYLTPPAPLGANFTAPPSPPKFVVSAECSSTAASAVSQLFSDTTLRFVRASCVVLLVLRAKEPLALSTVVCHLPARASIGCKQVKNRRRGRSVARLDQVELEAKLRHRSEDLDWIGSIIHGV